MCCGATEGCISGCVEGCVAGIFVTLFARWAGVIVTTAVTALTTIPSHDMRRLSRLRGGCVVVNRNGVSIQIEQICKGRKSVC